MDSSLDKSRTGRSSGTLARSGSFLGLGAAVRHHGFSEDLHALD